MLNIEELEWYSNCCNAPPLGEFHYEEKFDAQPVGMCMKCRESAVFYLEEPTIEELKKQHDEAMTSIAETRGDTDET